MCWDPHRRFITKSSINNIISKCLWKKEVCNILILLSCYTHGVWSTGRVYKEANWPRKRREDLQILTTRKPSFTSTVNSSLTHKFYNQQATLSNCCLRRRSCTKVDIRVHDPASVSLEGGVCRHHTPPLAPNLATAPLSLGDDWPVIRKLFTSQ